MTNQDYVTYPTAKLLKEAGYPQSKVNCKHYDLRGAIWSSKYDCPEFDEAVVAPHLWDALKWLREEHRIYTIITHQFYSTPPGWAARIADMDGKVALKQDSLWKYIKGEHGLGHTVDILFPTYEAACDAGIAAACEWLINKTNKQ